MESELVQRHIAVILALAGIHREQRVAGDPRIRFAGNGCAECVINYSRHA
ncbi:MAG TPA: hypothetical protein VII33_20900 [Nakamurella sp.]